MVRGRFAALGPVQPVEKKIQYIKIYSFHRKMSGQQPVTWSLMKVTGKTR